MNAESLRIESYRLGFIGAGRLATALAWSFARRGCRVTAAASLSRADAEKLAAPISSCTVASAQAVADACDLVFVTTPDEAIAPTVDSIDWRPGAGVVHCSGVTELSALGKAARDGAITGGFHPLQAFGDTEAAIRSLPGCTITVEADEPLNATLVALAGRLECRVNRLPPGSRGHYHAAAGYASQFINVLLREASKIWQSWGATEEDAVKALLPLVRGTLSAVESAGLAGAIPGPVSRGDIASVGKHVAALGRLDPEILRFYRALCSHTIPLALERGSLDQETAARIRRVLGENDSCNEVIDETKHGEKMSGNQDAGAGRRMERRDFLSEGVEALVFDVFGTVVDWRGSIIREGQALGLAKGLNNVDWVKFADEWRAGYQPAMHRVRTGQLPWTSIDDLHRMILDDLLKKHGIHGLAEAEIDHLNRAWHRLSPWPDSVVGLHRLKCRYVISTLSNGNVSLLVNMAKNGGLPWDAVLSAELTGHYKPDPEVYQTAARLLGLPPERVMMVAAHADDLLASQRVGLKTALVTRPLEYGPQGKTDTGSEGAFDVVASDFIDLARKLGA